MSHFRANEIFSDGPFIMLGISLVWAEKLTRFFSSRLLNCRPSGGRGRNDMRRTKPNEATRPKPSAIRGLSKKRTKRSHGVYPPCHQSLTAVLWLIFEKLGPINRFLYCRFGGWGRRLRDGGRPAQNRAGDLGPTIIYYRVEEVT